MTQIGRRGWTSLALAAIGALVLWGVTGTGAQGATRSTTFGMVRNSTLPSTCLPQASASVHIASNGSTETMTVTVSHLRPSTDYDFFVIQVPEKPFGMSWYQGDIQTTSTGSGTGKFIGRFSVETFVVAPGTAPAPTPHGSLDASTNPTTGPVHMFHLGLWFNSVSDAVSAHCAATGAATTPFNGTHTAGPQLLNTHTFANGNGPLNRIH